MSLINLIKENAKAFRFLLLFIGVYLILNTLYGFYIQYHYPGSDLFTRSIASQTVWFLNFFDQSIAYYPSSQVADIPIGNDRENVIYIFEGCNGLNVMIVYFSFLIAFTGPWKELVKFTLLGMVAIHIVNLMRIGLLYGVAFYFPEQLYFFHKYFFTGIIYVMVFVLWYYWIRRVRSNDSKQG